MRVKHRSAVTSLPRFAIISLVAHHKRKGPKSTRAGCLLCKPHKHQSERHRDRASQSRRWRERETAATRDGYRDRSRVAE
jgi:hypothetical protein